MTGPEVTQPDPDGGVEMTDGEWAAFRGYDGPEVTAAMKAEGVPKALVERMAAAICPNSRPEHKGVTYCIGCFKRAGEALAAVLPEVRAQAWQEGYITRAFTPLGPGGVPVQDPVNPYRLTATTEEPTT